MKIAYAGFDLLAPALEALLKEGCQLVKLFTCPVDQEYEFNYQVIRLAEKAGAPWTSRPVAREDIRLLKEEGCDAFISAAYYYRIPVDHELAMVNVHPSLLPQGRGAWPMPVQILRGEKQGGVTIHRLEEDFDRGPILLQKAFTIRDGENLETMTETIRSLLPDMMGELAADFRGLYESAKPQGKGSYYPCPTEKDWTIGPDTEARQADRILRAFYGFPCIYQEKGEARFELVRGRLSRPKPGSLPVLGGWVEAETVKEIKTP